MSIINAFLSLKNLSSKSHKDVEADASIAEACSKCGIHQASYDQWMILQSTLSDAAKRRYFARMLKEGMTSPVLGPITNDCLGLSLGTVSKG